MKDKNHNHVPDVVEEKVMNATRAALSEEHKLADLLRKHRHAATRRFPLAFTLLGAFGLVATFYGFEHVIDQIPFLVENPAILLAVGVGTLIGTGTLYKKLS